MRQILISWAATSCFLILAVVALRAALGKRMGAGLRYALWGLVLLRLLVPVCAFGQKTSAPAPWEELEAESTVRITGTVDGTTLARRGAFWHPGDWPSGPGALPRGC